MPYILAFALTMITAALTFPRSSGELTGLVHYISLTRTLVLTELSIYSFLFLWLALAAISGSYIWGNVSSLSHSQRTHADRFTGDELRLVAPA